MASFVSKLFTEAKPLTQVGRKAAMPHLLKYTPKPLEKYTELVSALDIGNASPALLQTAFSLPVPDMAKSVPDNTKLSILGSTVLDFHIGQALKRGNDMLSKNQITVLGTFIGGDYFLNRHFEHLKLTQYLPLQGVELGSAGIGEDQAARVVRAVVASFYQSKPEAAATYINRYFWEPSFLQTQILPQGAAEPHEMSTSSLSIKTIDTLVKYLLPSVTLNSIIKARGMPVLYAKYASVGETEEDQVCKSVLFSGDRKLGEAVAASPREAIHLAARNIIFSREFLPHLVQITAPDCTQQEDFDHIPILEDN